MGLYFRPFPCFEGIRRRERLKKMYRVLPYFIAKMTAGETLSEGWNWLGWAVLFGRARALVCVFQMVVIRLT